METRRGVPSWVEHRSGVTGCPHSGVDIFPEPSPRTKPYCGVSAARVCTSLPWIVECGETGDTIPPQ